jgi:acyl-coenzyme A synthetase/AMP-(fatty) acid ligase
VRIDRLLERLLDDTLPAPSFLGDETGTGPRLSRDVDALGRALRSPSSTPLLLACHDRYFACVGLLSCWLSGRVALFPPSLRSDVVRVIQDRHGGARVLSDEGEFGTPFRDVLSSGGARPAPPTDHDPNRVLATVYTSGSTGDPLGCHKTAPQLFGEAEYLARLLDVRSSSRVLCSAPPHHLYGLLFGVLVPLVAGAATVRLCSAMPVSLGRASVRHEVDTLCAVPPHLAGLLSLATRDLGPLERVICSAGRLDRELAEALSRRFAVRVVEVFGSSETGGIATRVFPEVAWRPFDCVQVDRDVDGALLIESPFLPPGQAGPFRSADEIELHADGSFTHLGRLDDVVKIGGERVSVQAVERAIRRLSGVSDAAVVRVPRTGSRQWELWACVATSGLDAEGLRRLLGGVLEPVAVPRRVKLVSSLPRESSGKIPRQRLLQLFEDEGS